MAPLWRETWTRSTLPPDPAGTEMPIEVKAPAAGHTRKVRANVHAETEDPSG